MAVRLSSEVLLAYAPEQDNPVQIVGYGTCTGDGAANGTTIVDADGIAKSGGADTYNGHYFVEILSGSYKGESKRVIDDDGAGTLTLEGTGFPGQILTGVAYRLIASPEPVLVVDSSGGATDVVDAVRDEANDYWNGYWITPLTGDRAGETKQISDFTSASGTFVTSAFTGALAAGDVCMLRKVIEAGNVSFSPAHAYIERSSTRANSSRGDGIVGAKSGTISFEKQFSASGSLAGNGVEANGCDVSGLLEACGFTEYRGKTLTVDDASATTTSIDIATGTQENVNIGQAIMYAGNVAFVTAKTDGDGGVDNITVYPPLPVAPGTADLLYACRMYATDTEQQGKSCTIYYERDGVRYTLFGCRGNLEIVPGDDTEVMFKFTFTFAHYISEDQTEIAQNSLGSAYSTAQVLIGADRIFYLAATRYDVGGVSANFNREITPKKVSGAYGLNGVAGMVTKVGKQPTIVLNRLLEDSAEGLPGLSDFKVRTARVLTAIYGSHGNCFALKAPVARSITAPHPVDSDGLLSEPYTLECQDAGSATDPTLGTIKVPDLSLCIF